MPSEIVPFTEASFEGASCAFGVFDGVHRGHRFIIDRALKDAHARAARAIIITFDIDPSELFGLSSPEKLMTNEERIAHLAKLGVDEVAVIPFDDRVASLAPEEFLDELFAQGVPASLSVGEDFRFGRHASGTKQDLEAWGRSHGMAVDGVALFQLDGSPVTSTRVRALLERGEVAEAHALLGHPYALTGKVASGRQVGREIGVCTANLVVDPSCVIPADGVYAAYALVDGRRCKAAVSVGVPVTFDDARQSTIEAHLLDFDEDIYGKTMTLEFMERLRPMIKFDSPEALVAQITKDIERTRQLP